MTWIQSAGNTLLKKKTSRLTKSDTQNDASTLLETRRGCVIPHNAAQLIREREAMTDCLLKSNFCSTSAVYLTAAQFGAVYVLDALYQRLIYFCSCVQIEEAAATPALIE